MSKDIIMLNFYADWCRFSQMLRPIFDKAADALSQEFPVSPSIMWATVCAVHAAGAVHLGWHGIVYICILTVYKDNLLFAVHAILYYHDIVWDHELQVYTL